MGRSGERRRGFPRAVVPESCTDFPTLLLGYFTSRFSLARVHSKLTSPTCINHFSDIPIGSLLASWLNDYIKVICKQYHTQYTKKLNSIRGSVFVSFVPIICLMPATW